MRVPLAAVAALPILLLATLLLGCSANPEPGARFADEGLAQLSCMQHQPAAPGPRYTDPSRRSIAETLPVLRYYTANGAKPYCDGTPATAVDRSWAQLYVELGADRTKVAALL